MDRVLEKHKHATRKKKHQAILIREKEANAWRSPGIVLSRKSMRAVLAWHKLAVFRRCVLLNAKCKFPAILWSRNICDADTATKTGRPSNLTFCHFPNRVDQAKLVNADSLTVKPANFKNRRRDPPNRFSKFTRSDFCRISWFFVSWWGSKTLWISSSLSRYRHGVVLCGTSKYARICARSACWRIEVGISELFVSIS